MLPKLTALPASKLAVLLAETDDRSFLTAVLDVVRVLCGDNVAVILLGEALQRALVNSFSLNLLSCYCNLLDLSKPDILIQNSKLDGILLRCESLSILPEKTMSCLREFELILRTFGSFALLTLEDVENQNQSCSLFRAGLIACGESSAIYKLLKQPDLSVRDDFIVGVFSVVLSLHGLTGASTLHRLRGTHNDIDFDYMEQPARRS